MKLTISWTPTSKLSLQLEIGKAPTMAITAMGKTAKMKEEEKEKATKAILKKTYVEDIWDSVKSAEEAKVLTKEVAEILESVVSMLRSGI